MLTESGDHSDRHSAGTSERVGVAAVERPSRSGGPWPQASTTSSNADGAGEKTEGLGPKG